MDSAAILSSLTQSPPRGAGEGAGITSVGSDLPTSDPTTQRKITLLTRPVPPVPSSVPATSPVGVASIIVGGEGNPLISELPQSLGASGLADTLPTQGRAARNDYYDTEDPSVNLHEFIVNSLQAQKNRVVLLKLEEEFLTYVTDPKRVDPLKLPPWDSYHRMLAHRVAAYFGLEHNVDPVDKSCVVVCKGPQTRIPMHRFSDFLAVDPDSDSAEPKLILKRASRESVVALEKSFEALNLPSDVKSFEQREEEYEKARARIFNQQPLQDSHSTIAFDLGSAPQRTRSSLLPAIMQHRRTVSDTLLFRRPSVLDELKKDAPNSSHSSRSATPLLTLLQPTGEGGMVGQTLVGQGAGSKVPAGVTPQHSPQQPKMSPRELPSSQSQILHQNPMRPQNKYPRQRPTNVPSFQFQPLPQRGIPVFYPQQAAIMTDPNWYYNNMMLYQVSPQQFIPAAATGPPYGQMMQPTLFPVNQQYPISPGVIAAPPAQSPVISPPISSRPGPHMRLPMVSPTGAVVDSSIPSPSHLQSGGVTLVRPVAQVATPNRGSFKFDTSPSSSVVQPQGYSIGQPVGTVLGGIGHQRPQAGQLADHMDQLAIGRRGIGGGLEVGEGRMGQIGGDIGMLGKKQGLHMGDGGRNGKAVLNGSFPSGYAMMPALDAGQVMSPTQVPPGAMQFLPAHIQHPHMVPGSQDPQLVSPQHVPPGTPGGVVHFPGSLTNQSPSAPTTPPIGHVGFPTLPSMLTAQQQQSVFSPPSTGVTHSPVQILGHTLGTSLFSPPPSSTAHHGMFVNSSTGGKVMGYPSGSPAHAPVGSGIRFRKYESPKQGGHVSEVSTSVPLPQTQAGGGLSQVQFMSENPVPQQKLHPKGGNNGSNGGGNSLSGATGFQPVQLPPRLASQQQPSTPPQRNTGTRYQNQRHPANRATQVNKPSGGNGNGGDGGAVAEAGQYLQLTGGVGKKEPLLPTPPNTQMVKLDTTLTCGVPLHVMEIVSLPPEGTPERQRAYQILHEIGALDITGGRINKTGEEVLIAMFPSPDVAIKALQMHNMPFTLSIPRNNHAKFILSLLSP